MRFLLLVSALIAIGVPQRARGQQSGSTVSASVTVVPSVEAAAVVTDSVTLREVRGGTVGVRLRLSGADTRGVRIIVGDPGAVCGAGPPPLAGAALDSARARTLTCRVVVTTNRGGGSTAVLVEVAITLAN